jgi:hypothetical protein
VAAAKSWIERLWSEERRRANRKESLPLAAYYWDGSVPAPRQVRDISPEGMYLLTEQRWYLNTLINMTLVRSDKPEDDPERSVRLTARVVRSGTDGVGMAFLLPRKARSGAGAFNEYDADRKSLIGFLARLQADTGRTVLMVFSMVLAVVAWSQSAQGAGLRLTRFAVAAAISLKTATPVQFEV